jgi:hypothetical protein
MAQHAGSKSVPLRVQFPPAPPNKKDIMTRRPIRPIAEQGIYTKPRKPSFGEAVEDAIVIALAYVFCYPIYIVANKLGLYKKEN